VNSPKKQKYQYWTGDTPKDADIDSWMAKAKEHPGSWWPDWFEWIKSHGADEAPAREPGGGKLKAIEDAPGRYVRVPS
jgi:polyhydroxyalkanoate synthase